MPTKTKKNSPLKKATLGKKKYANEDVVDSDNSGSDYNPNDKLSVAESVLDGENETTASKKRNFSKKQIGKKGKVHKTMTNIADDVILCGQNTLRCENAGNVFFKELIFAAVVLHHLYNEHEVYDKMDSEEEIYSTLRKHKWVKIVPFGQRLTVDEIKLKFRKSINDRINKMRKNLRKVTDGKDVETTDDIKVEFYREQVAKVTVELNYFDVFDFHPLDTKPRAIIRESTVDNVDYDKGKLDSENDSEKTEVEASSVETNDNQSFDAVAEVAVDVDDTSDESTSDLYKRKKDKEKGVFYIETKKLPNYDDYSDDDIVPLREKKRNISEHKCNKEDRVDVVGLLKERKPKRDETSIRKSTRLSTSYLLTQEGLGAPKRNDTKTKYDYDPSVSPTEDELIDRQVIIGLNLDRPAYDDDETDAKKNIYLSLKNKKEKDTFDDMKETMNDMLEEYLSLTNDDIGFATESEVDNRYVLGRKSFSVICPQKESTGVKIFMGSHRLKYVKGGGGKKHVVHRSMVTEIRIPEKCMLIMDENLVHAGTGSMLVSYGPIFSPRYFAYLHPKEKVVDKNFSYDYFEDCDDECNFCQNRKVCRLKHHLRHTLSILECQERNGIASRTHINDWVAGDLVALGWVIVRSGVAVNLMFEKALAHEFQTILLTPKFTSEKNRFGWTTIDSKKSTSGGVIPGTFRSYLHGGDSTVRKTTSLQWGKRKMFPFHTKNMLSNMEWLRVNGFISIAGFLERLETNLIIKNIEDENGSALSQLVGENHIRFDNYTFSGQCVIANFGLVQEQGWHMDYELVEYD